MKDCKDCIHYFVTAGNLQSPEQRAKCMKGHDYKSAAYAFKHICQGEFFEQRKVLAAGHQSD